MRLSRCQFLLRVLRPQIPEFTTPISLLLTGRYVGVFEQMYMLERVDVWATNQLNRVVKTPKLQFIDSGLLAMLIDLHAAEVGKTAPGSALCWIESSDSTKMHDSSGGSMQTMTANQAKTQFGAFIDMAQKEPVRVMRHDRVVGVMVSASDYEAMRAFYANRLARTLDQTAANAAAAGLTPQQLDTLLADES